MYLGTYLKSHQRFTFFILSVEGFIGVEEESTLTHITSRLTTKWKEPYSRIYGYMKSTIAITLIRGLHICIWRSRVPASQISMLSPQ